MTEPVSGCAAWATVDDIPATPAEMHTAAQWGVYLGMATDILWALTGRQWRGAGLSAEVSLRAAPPRPGEGAWPWHSSWGHCPCYAGLGADGPRWVADWGHAHTAPAAVRLPHRDITAITAVTIDGVAFTEWRLDGAWLARTDGEAWPVCNDRTLVTYDYGQAPPDAGRQMCVELAVELGRSGSASPDRPCQLPQRLQSVNRQGISFAALDDMDFLDKGLTGLYAVDLWVKSVNPKGRAKAASVWSPDLPRARRRT